MENYVARSIDTADNAIAHGAPLLDGEATWQILLLD